MDQKHKWTKSGSKWPKYNKYESTMEQTCCISILFGQKKEHWPHGTSSFSRSGMDGCLVDLKVTVGVVNSCVTFVLPHQSNSVVTNPAKIRHICHSVLRPSQRYRSRWCWWTHWWCWFYPTSQIQWLQSWPKIQTFATVCSVHLTIVDHSVGFTTSVKFSGKITGQNTNICHNVLFKRRIAIL